VLDRIVRSLSGSGRGTRAATVIASVSFLTLASTGGAAAQNWTSLGAANSPLPTGAAFALDTQRYRLVMFGGQLNPNEATLSGSTWTFDQHGGPAQGLVPPAAGDPSARMAAAMIYDPVGDRMVMFGGAVGPNGSTSIDELWQRTESDGTWSPLAAGGTPPPPLMDAAAVYDPVRRRMVVFGGRTGWQSGYQNATWALSLDGVPTWTALAPTGTPPNPRFGAVLTYDSLRDRVLLFGGNGNPSRPDGNNDVWSLTLDASPAWTRFYPEVLGTAAHFDGTAFYDPHRDRLIVWGGYGLQQPPRALSLTPPIAWSSVDVTDGAEPWRAQHAWFYDPLLDRLSVCGGVGVGIDGTSNGTYEQDTWTLNFGSPVTAVGPAASARLAIERVARGPDGVIDVVLALVPGGGAARLEIFDVEGRRVAAARISPGTQRATLRSRGGLEAGVFFARLQQGSATAAKRVALWR